MATLVSYALTSVADVKESLGIASSDLSWDNLIIRKINQATDQIEKYCQRRFLSTTYTDEIYDASGTDQMVLNQRPVTNLASFYIRDTSLNNNTFESIDSELYYLNANAGIIDLLFRTPGHWSRYKVTYTAGYTTIPNDLAEACASLVCYYVLNADASDVGFQEKREGQRLIRYANSALTFSTLIQQLGIDAIINSYANYPVLAEG